MIYKYDKKEEDNKNEENKENNNEINIKNIYKRKIKIQSIIMLI